MVLKKFDPIESAESLKIKLQDRYKLSIEIVSELYEAQKFYSNSGFRTDLVSNDTRLNTFEEYINYIGMFKPTVYRWLDRYIPEENKLLTFEELKEHKKEQEQIDNKKIFEFKQTGIKPEGWERRHDYLYKKTLDDSEYEKRKSAAFDKKEKENKLVDDDIEASKQKLIDIENMKNQLTKETDIKEKLRLSNSDKNISQEIMFETIEDFLNDSDGINEKLQKANNIILFVRDIAVKLQTQTIKR